MNPAPPVTSTRIRACRSRELRLEKVDRGAEPFVQPHLRLPTEYPAGLADVGLSNLGIVDGQRFVHDLGSRSGQLDDPVRELENGHLGGVPDVDRVLLLGPQKPDDALDEILDVTEASRLATVAVHGERLVLQRLAHEIRHHASVPHTHPRAVGVEDPHDAGLHAVAPRVSHRHRLEEPLRLVVHSARTDRIDVAPVVFALRMDERVAVHLGRGGEREFAHLLRGRGPARCGCRASRP